MKTAASLLVSVFLAMTAVFAVFTFFQIRSEEQSWSEEQERIAEAFSRNYFPSVLISLKDGDSRERKELLDWVREDDSDLGILVYDGRKLESCSLEEPLARSETWLAQAQPALSENRTAGPFLTAGNRRIFFQTVPSSLDRTAGEKVILIRDAESVKNLQEKTLRENFILYLILLIPSSLLAFMVMRKRITHPLAQIAEKLKRLRLGKDARLISLTRSDILGVLGSEITYLADSLTSARAAAREEARLRLSAESVWTAEKLSEHVRARLGGKPLFLVSNREPYMHVRQKRKIECVVPPSGLVTALEPVMRACGGMWIAHGSGDADRETCENGNKIQVPPDEPAYLLKRVWLTKEEENGHYYGFSNEGLWPLCHNTHVRPVFRLEDWSYYRKVNEKFAEAVFEEIEGEEFPLLLIQDYHFALLPRLIREKRPDARIALFWHIPWPNPEAFSICPWKKEILRGMLGADIIGFHIQYHCNNFLDTVDNILESKIDWEQFSVERDGHLTYLRALPISVNSFSETVPEKGNSPDFTFRLNKENVYKEYGINSRVLAVGVDRLDYTKGILERFKAVERFLEKYPEYLRNFTLVELGAPSRSHIQKYQDFVSEAEKTAEQINWRFQSRDWKPILFLKGQHRHEEIVPFYKAADLCLVTSLHDGMNLVAKEFVSSRGDEDGVLILSEFTGASRELREALIVNPYDIESMAECIRLAVEMPKEQRQERMKRLRKTVREKNVYRWAADLISAMVQLTPEKEKVPA